MIAKTLISVVIPARNAADTIRRQLEAVCTQQVDGSFEVVIVDNGSTDATADVVVGLTAGFPHVRLVPGPAIPNRSTARNVGAAHAVGELLAFCDADDVVAPGWLAALTGALDDRDVVTGALVRVAKHDAGMSTTTDAFRTEFRGIKGLASGNFAIRRRLFEEVGGFSEDIKHRVDIELSCRLYLRGIRVEYAPEAKVMYTRRAGMLDEARQHFRWAMADVYIQKLYGNRIPFAYSWKNSMKHWALVGPSFVRAVVRREDLRPPVLTMASLLGRLTGSVRHRKWAI